MKPVAVGGEGLMDRLGVIEQQLNVQKKSEAPPKRTTLDKLTGKGKVDKQFKLPLKVKIGEKQKLKKNYSLVLFIKNNGYVTLDFAPIEDDYVYNRQSSTYHQATADYTLWYGKYPLLIIPEYSNIPYKAKEHAEEIEAEGLSSRNQKVLMSIQKKIDAAGKKKISGNILWIIFGIIILVWLIASIFGVEI